MEISTELRLKTGRLRLRYPDLHDAGVIFEGIQSPQFPERLPLKELSSRRAVTAWLYRLQENWKNGRGYSWVVTGRRSERFIGQVTLSRLNPEGTWSLAFWIHPEHWGRGFASESTRCCLAFGFGTLQAEKIWAAAGEWNLASCRVLEKIGLTFIRHNDSGYQSRGRPVPTREYEITREEWLNHWSPEDVEISIPGSGTDPSLD